MRPAFISPKVFREYLPLKQIDTIASTGSEFVDPRFNSREKISSFVRREFQADRPLKFLSGPPKGCPVNGYTNGLFRLVDIHCRLKACGKMLLPWGEQKPTRADWTDFFDQEMEARWKSLYQLRGEVEELADDKNVLQAEIDGLKQLQFLSKSLTNGELLDDEDILQGATRIEELSGVYFLLDVVGTIVYVGQSVNVFSRIQQHWTEKVKKFDRFAFILMPAERLDLMESLYIRLLKPPLNKSSPLSLSQLQLLKSTKESSI